MFQNLKTETAAPMHLLQMVPRPVMWAALLAGGAAVVGVLSKKKLRKFTFGVPPMAIAAVAAYGLFFDQPGSVEAGVAGLLNGATIAVEPVYR